MTMTIKQDHRNVVICLIFPLRYQEMARISSEFTKILGERGGYPPSPALWGLATAFQDCFTQPTGITVSMAERPSQRDVS